MMKKTIKTKSQIRLASHIVAEKYDLTMFPNLEKLTFSGEEVIHLKFLKSDFEITIHSKDLEINSAKIIQGREEQFAIRTVYNQETETVTLVFPKKLKTGTAQLYLKFQGQLNDQMRGFYHSRYQHLGKDRYLATTQFESTDARRAFPCFDEPAAKAIFNVSLVVPDQLTTISNTILSEVREHDQGYKIVKFEPTPKMSTYLLAFIVGNFEFLETKTTSGILVRVFVTPGKKHQAQFALDTAAKMLEFYNKYFGIRYPLPVLDLIAIPDFAAGAMENWGAITYRETALLIDPQESSASSKQWVALVIAHELAHQWFGNLVTMEWWTHLWLNEGFASYIEYLAVDHVFPDWNIWTQFVFADLGQALQLDGLENTHPVEIEVHHPDEISEIFDAVSYSKGASIIRMLASYLGERKFRDGLRYYLKKHSYGNASTEDLWKAFEYISKKPVKKIMAGWTKQPGYPLLTLNLKKGKLKISQKRFFANPISAQNNKNKKISWQIPVSVWEEGKSVQQMLMSGKEMAINAPKKVFKINALETGFFRTAYSSEMLNDLKVLISNKQLSAEDRLGIVRDCFALSETGDISTEQTIRFLEAYSNETNYNVWVEILSGLAWLDNLLADDKAQIHLHHLARTLLNNIIRQVSWAPRNGENQAMTLMRCLVLSNVVRYGHSETIREAKSLFSNAKSPEEIDPNVRPAVYAAMTRYGSAKDYQKLKSWYKQANLNEEKNRLARALTQTQNKKLFIQTLKFALSKDVRQQDSPLLLVSAWSNNRYKNEIWLYMQENWDELLKRFGNGGYLLRRIIEPLGNLTGKGQDKAIAKFFKNNSAPGGERAIQQAIEQISSNNHWQSRELQRIRRFLQNWPNQL